MSFTGVGSFGRGIQKAYAWLAGIGEGSGTCGRRLAGVFYDGWNPSRLPVRYDCGEYVMRFARDARVRDSGVAEAAAVVTAVTRQHVPAGAVDEAPGLLPAGLRRLLEPDAAGPVTGGAR